MFTDCADARDKVYGTLGIATEWTIMQQRSVPIDYNLEVGEVFCAATKAVMQISRNLDLLTLIPARALTADSSALPSWCPDYNGKM